MVGPQDYTQGVAPEALKNSFMQAQLRVAADKLIEQIVGGRRSEERTSRISFHASHRWDHSTVEDIVRSIAAVENGKCLLTDASSASLVTRLRKPLLSSTFRAWMWVYVHGSRRAQSRYACPRATQAPCSRLEGPTIFSRIPRRQKLNPSLSGVFFAVGKNVF